MVGEAYNGRHAVDTFHLHMPHITVMDFIMPELNGLEASRHLFRQYPERTAASCWFTVFAASPLPFQVHAVANDHDAIEGQPGFRAVPGDKLLDGALVNVREAGEPRLLSTASLQ